MHIKEHLQLPCLLFLSLFYEEINNMTLSLTAATGWKPFHFAILLALQNLQQAGLKHFSMKAH